jgi:hypothetical protein
MQQHSPTSEAVPLQQHSPSSEAVPLQLSPTSEAVPLKQHSPTSEAIISEISRFHFGIEKTQSPEVAPCLLPVAFRQCYVSRDSYRVCTMKLLTGSTAKVQPEQVSALWLLSPAPTRQY